MFKSHHILICGCSHQVLKVFYKLSIWCRFRAHHSSLSIFCSFFVSLSPLILNVLIQIYTTFLFLLIIRRKSKIEYRLLTTSNKWNMKTANIEREVTSIAVAKKNCCDQKSNGIDVHSNLPSTFYWVVHTRFVSMFDYTLLYLSQMQLISKSPRMKNIKDSFIINTFLTHYSIQTILLC